MAKELGKIKIGCPEDNPWEKRTGCPEDKPESKKNRYDSGSYIPRHSIRDRGNPLDRYLPKPSMCYFVPIAAATTMIICRHHFSKTICSYVGSKEVWCKSSPIPPRHQASSMDNLIPAKTKDGKPLTRKQINDHKLIDEIWKETCRDMWKSTEADIGRGVAKHRKAQFFCARKPDGKVDTSRLKTLAERIQQIYSKKYFRELPHFMQIRLKDYGINAQSYNEARDRWANSLDDIKAMQAFDSVIDAISAVRDSVESGLQGVLKGIYNCVTQ